MCALLPTPGIFDDTLPMVFPDNWPDEAFWFLAETNIPTVAGYGMDAYAAGIEAAFSGGNPVDGDPNQLRAIRIRVNVPVAGDYTITHPLRRGKSDCQNPGTSRQSTSPKTLASAQRATFTGALNGAIGPFLHGVKAPYTVN